MTTRVTIIAGRGCAIRRRITTEKALQFQAVKGIRDTRNEFRLQLNNGDTRNPGTWTKNEIHTWVTVTFEQRISGSLTELQFQGFNHQDPI